MICSFVKNNKIEKKCLNIIVMQDFMIANLKSEQAVAAAFSRPMTVSAATAQARSRVEPINMNHQYIISSTILHYYANILVSAYSLKFIQF